MPKPGTEKHDGLMEGRAPAPLAVAAQGDVQVVPEPAGQGDVPTPPEFLDGGADIGVVEIF